MKHARVTVFAFTLAGTLLMLATTPGLSTLTALRPTPSRPLTRFESIAKIIDEQPIVALVRVRSVAGQARRDTSIQPNDPLYELRPYLRPARLEVVEWLRGGLDSDVLEINTYEGGPFERPTPPGWRALAGVDTMGAIVSLRDSPRQGWMLASIDFITVPEREFEEARRLAFRARESLQLDSLVARADLIVVGSVFLAGPRPIYRSELAVERTLKGQSRGRLVEIRSLFSLTQAGRGLWFLERGAGDSYVPFPAHRNAWAGSWERGGDSSFAAREAEVAAAVERWSLRTKRRR